MCEGLSSKGWLTRVTRQPKALRHQASCKVAENKILCYTANKQVR
jgi:hypothetical protein